MKNTLLTIFFLLCVSLSFSQQEKNTAALQQFQEYYNAGDSDAIYNMLGASFQKSIGQENIKQLMSRFQNSLGNFISFKFSEGQKDVDTFLGTFEKGEQNIAITAKEDGKIYGFLFKPVENNRPPKFERNTTKLRLPFEGDWFTVWGGTTKMQNYHVTVKVQQGAFDFLKLGPNNKTYVRSGTRNEDYYAFGQPLYAVCDAVVSDVITGIEDNRPTIMNPGQPLGNSVTLLTDNGEYIVYAHLENETVAVKKGDTVKKGQYLGNCGNSGNSSEAHLHLHIQDGPEMMTAIGARCFFEEVKVGEEIRTDYSPVRLDKISRPKKE
ncbi:peptidoglycan DD-metalloendopeptidase family protein [Rasiella rasia]|uniref:Peptidoglycan DD-metalloendopeptidase family protein n=1 Tax=Rasiella rasia TaxID=2744027 RepID=A0A6G6GJY1_9FLAO|nr:peptidoglycan DD-metalloendopeptidase family protein [Rasiella rasia]QIE58896.1 peptidoglycan DD-metalloendopeptidase family protein [Rasiella rasia]